MAVMGSSSSSSSSAVPRALLLVRRIPRADRVFQRRTLFELPELFPSLTSNSGSSSGSSKGKFHSERRVLGYSREQMFDVVSDVGSYQNFVPWCNKSEVLARGEGWLKARLTMQATPVFSDLCHSHVSLFRPNMVVAVSTDSRLLESIKSVWRFDPVPNKGGLQRPDLCLVDVAVALTFKNFALTRIAEVFANEAVLKNVDAFLREATRRYGKEATVPEADRKAILESSENHDLLCQERLKMLNNDSWGKKD